MRFVPFRNFYLGGYPTVAGPKNPWPRVLSLPERFVGDPVSLARVNILFLGTPLFLGSACLPDYRVSHDMYISVLHVVFCIETIGPCEFIINRQFSVITLTLLRSQKYLRYSILFWGTPLFWGSAYQAIGYSPACISGPVGSIIYADLSLIPLMDLHFETS